MEKKKRISGVGEPENLDDTALIEFSQQAYKDSVTTIKDFIKLMIPLCTGLITAYFGLLEFFGDDSSRNIPIDSSILMTPAYF